MDISKPLHLLPTLSMVVDILRRAGWECQARIAEEDRNYRGIRLFHQQPLQKDVLYLVRPEETRFPFEEYTYICACDHDGGNCLICPGRPDAEILDQLLEIFSQFQNWEDSIDDLLYRNASLQELCELGARLLGNPVCIHDDWFVMMAMTAEFSQVMEPEYLMTSTKGFVPRAVVEDFQYDSDYLETYSHHTAQVWCPVETDRPSLYVNLWDGPVYKGRLLVSRKNREFRPQDFLVAEALTQRAVMLLRRKQLGDNVIHQNMDDIVFSLLQGKQTDPSDLARLLSMLHWQKPDKFLCLRLRPQENAGTAMMEHVLHSDLFRLFPESYILLEGHEQCIIVKLSGKEITPTRIRHRLAPLCRDYCLYAGISSPVIGIRELHAAYYQAGAALDQAFRLRGEKWLLSFSECAMEHVLRNLPSPLLPNHLISPELQLLRHYDREKGTQYFDTFREYLLQERDIPRTSQALIIHRTTLLYRLQKIRSLIHGNPEDPWQRLYWILSLWLLEKEDSQKIS